MTEYLARGTPAFTAPETVAAFDELPLWCAMAGLFLLEHLPLPKGATVLDLGCGTGFPLLELAQRLGRPAIVHGLDPWGQALARARFKAGVIGVTNITLTRGDGAAMPYPASRFDLIVSNLGINNFADPDAVLADCHRVLKPHGRLALTTNIEGHMAELYTLFAEVLSEHNAQEAKTALHRHIAHRGTVATIGARLQRAGFQVTRAVERTFPMRFADGTALFHHYFIRLGFLEGWRTIVTRDTEHEVFSDLEHRLNNRAAERGELNLTIPLAYLEAESSS